MSDIISMMKVARYKLNKELTKDYRMKLIATLDNAPSERGFSSAMCFRSVLKYQGNFRDAHEIQIDIEVPEDVNEIFIGRPRWTVNDEYYIHIKVSCSKNSTRNSKRMNLNDAAKLREKVLEQLNATFERMPPDCSYIKLNENIVPLVKYLVRSGVLVDSIYQYQSRTANADDTAYSNNSADEVSTFIKLFYNDQIVNITHTQLIGYKCEMMIIFSCENLTNSAYKVGYEFSDLDLRRAFDYVDILSNTRRRQIDAKND
jgi:hypothetical protein